MAFEKGFSPAPEVMDVGVSPEKSIDRPGEGENWANAIELPEDTGGWQDSIELPDDAGEWQDSIELPDDMKSIADANGSEILTEKELNEMQQTAIKNALERIARGEKLTTQEVGNLCEMMMDQYYISKGFTPLHDRVVSLDQAGHQGIDGVYEKDGKFIIADAKYNTAQLQETQDGRQLSESWINNRLDACVGKEKADQIREAVEDDPDNISIEVFHYDPKPDEDGKSCCEVYHVDHSGYKCDSPVVAEIYQNGEPVRESSAVGN